MATAIEDDPYSWGVETLADYLCNRLTTNSTQIRSILHDEEIDGSTFLRYAKLAGGEALLRLFDVTRLKAKLVLLEAVDDLQTASNAYQDWLFKKNAPEALLRAEPSHHGTVIDVPTPQSIPKGPFSTAPEAVPTEAAAPVPAALIDDSPENGQATRSPRPETYSYDGLLTDSPGGIAQIDSSLKRPAHPSTEGEQQPAKKRIVPTLLQSRPTIVNPVFAQPDFISMGSDMEPFSSRTLASTKQPAYLGRGFLVANEVTSNDVPGLLNVVDLGEDSFIAVGSYIPPGRRQVVHKAMRRLLVRNGRQEDAIRQGFDLPESVHGSDYDEVLSLVDPTEDLDEQTLREIEEDDEESEAAPDRLSQEDVDTILDEYIASREADWKERKLPKKGRAAYQLWDSTQRRRREKAAQAQQRRHQLTERVRKIRKDFLEEEWSSRQALLDMARVLEQTIDDRCLAAWQYDILTAREPPPFVPASFQHQSQRIRVEHVAGEGELILSDDEDFVVDDAPVGTTMKEDPALAPEMMDLTQIETPKFETPKKQSNRVIDTIDLTGDTPTKPEADVIENNNHDDAGGSIEAHVDVQLLKGTNPEEVFRNSKWEGLCSALWNMIHAQRMAIFALARKSSPDAWRAMTTSCTLQDTATSDEDRNFVRNGAIEMTRLFYMFSRSVFARKSSFEKRFQDQAKREKLLRNLQKHRDAWWPPFLQFLRKVAPRYPTDEQILNHDQLFVEMGDDSDMEEMPDDVETGEHSSRRRPAVSSEVVLDKGALDFRAREAAWAAELQERQQRLRAQVAAQTGPMPQNSPRLIINEGKKDEEGFVCVNHEIAAKIKDHQIDGVRFLWAQVIRDETERTGGLLAHTMGLGKTMQVITFLVAVQEAAKSSDPNISCQIPNDLKKNRTLIVCPASLVNNWVDEIIIWDSMDYLKPLRKIDSHSMPPHAREVELKRWAAEGGILIVSYPLVAGMIGKHEKLGQILRDTPNIVVADEAHKMKNRKSGTSKACHQFSTLSRIALTGSPLNNNVGEYYAMIDWVAPGFLGPHEEFQQTYGRIIEQGLYKDSSGTDKKRAIYKLRVLTGTIKPKVHRRTVAALKHELPNKNENVIFLESTPLQKQLYNEWIRISRESYTGQTMTGFLFTILEYLKLICNHPRCLQQKFQKERDKKLHEDSPVVVFQQVANKLLASEEDMLSESLSLKTSVVTQLLDEARLLREKVLLFSTSIETLDYLELLFRNQKRQCVRLDGKTNVAKRQAQTKRFNDDSTEVFLISTKAGGVGLNMQGACRVIIFDTQFNPAEEQQAIGRAYRIGQKKPVHVYRLVMAGTFEADIHNRSVFKTQLASRVVDDKKTLTWAKRNSQLVHELQEARNENLSPFRGKDRVLDKLIDTNADRSIKRLLSSDTFEEEDLDDLTEQERQAADTMVEENRKLQRLRHTDPVEYERQRARLEEHEARRLGAEQAAAVSQPSRPQTYTVAALVSPFQLGPGVSGLTQPAQGVQTSSHGAPSTSHGPLSSATGANLASFDGAGDDQYPATNGPSIGPVPLPIMGANTYIGGVPRDYVFKTPAPGPTTKATPIATTPQPRTSKIPFEASATNEFMWKDNFRQRLAERCREVQRTMPASFAPNNIEQLAAQISYEIKHHLDERRTEHGESVMEVGLRWRTLQNLLEHDKLVYAVAKGRLTPSFLAASSSEDLFSRAEVFERMTSVELCRPPPRSEDPKYFTKARTASVSAAERPSNRGQSLGDEEIMRAVASRRLQRGESERTRTPDRSDATRLPGWGHKALADHSPRP